MPRLFPLLLVLLLPSCASEAPEETPSDVLRTFGSVDLEIGRLDGVDAFVFSRISGLIADEAGRIFVADHQTSEIRVFSPDGDFLFVLNREGSGPGELSAPCCLGWGPEGTLWVRDGNNRRYNGYELGDSSAFFVEQRLMAHSDVNFWAPLSFDLGGALVDVGHRTTTTGNVETVRFRLGPEGPLGATETVPVPRPEDIAQHTVTREAVRFFVSQPFGPRQVVGHGPGGTWAHAISSSYDITTVSPSRSIILSREMEGPELSAREIELARAQMDRQTSRAGVEIEDLPFSIPERKPPVRNLFVDAVGRIWVERHVPDGDQRLADIWSVDGELESEFRWPADVNLSLPGWIGPDYALGVRTDSLGVNYVVRLRY